MKQSNKLRKMLLLLVCGAGVASAGNIYAQSSESETTAEVGVVKDAKLSPAEMAREADDQIKKMQGMLARLVELQNVARKQKDVIKLNCVNDKLLQVKQLLNIAESARTDLVEATAQKDSAAQTHAYGQIAIAGEKVQGMREEAEGCIGEELVFLGPTEIGVDAPDIVDDPTDEDTDGLDLEPPGYASPFS